MGGRRNFLNFVGPAPPLPSAIFPIDTQKKKKVKKRFSWHRNKQNSVAKWLNRGLRLERNDPGFKARVDHLDAAISERS